jgi:hypothetical protein
MRATSLAAEIHGTLGARPDLRTLVLRVRDPDAPPNERDAGLREVVLAYRSDRSWSPLLLELLAPGMARRLALLQPQQPVITEDDVRQQLVVEVLQAAATMPLPLGARFVERAILLRAMRQVVRCLEREEEHRDWTEPLPEDDDDNDEEEEE